MGIFDLLKRSVGSYSDPYDFRIDAILKIVRNLLDGDVGDLRKVKSGNDWMFGGGTLHGLMGTQVLNDYYSNEIESCYHRGMSINDCVNEISLRIDKRDFLRMCDEFANRPI